MANTPVTELWIVAHWRKAYTVPINREDAERFALMLHAANKRDGITGPINLIPWVEYRALCLSAQPFHS
jgi:hypothetical protein